MTEYTLKRSARAKYMRLTVRPGGAVVVTAPLFESAYAIERFMREKSTWIERAVAKMRHLIPLPGGKREYEAHREAARALVHERLKHWNATYRFSYGRISIKNTSSLWGSCSRKGNLNFSYKIIHLPSHLADYVIIHELCHLGEHNHGARFWALVAKAQPEYLHFRQELRRYMLRP